jgi:hypothetical protein
MGCPCAQIPQAAKEETDEKKVATREKTGYQKANPKCIDTHRVRIRRKNTNKRQKQAKQAKGVRRDTAQDDHPSLDTPFFRPKGTTMKASAKVGKGDSKKDVEEE